MTTLRVTAHVNAVDIEPRDVGRHDSGGDLDGRRSIHLTDCLTLWATKSELEDLVAHFAAVLTDFPESPRPVSVDPPSGGEP